MKEFTAPPSQRPVYGYVPLYLSRAFNVENMTLQFCFGTLRDTTTGSETLIQV